MMKILFFSRVFGAPTMTFIQRQVSDIFKRYNGLYLCNENEGKLEEDSSFKIVEEPFRHSLEKASFKNLMRKWNISLCIKSKNFQKKLGKHVKDVDPSIIHAQFGYDALRIYKNYTLDRPLVVSFRGFDASRMLKSRLYRKELKIMLEDSRVYTTFVCKYLRDNVLQIGIKLPNPNLTLYSNTDVDFFKPDRSIDAFPIFTFVQISSFREKKGHLHTIEAINVFFDRYPNIEAQFIFAGQGSEFNKARKRVDQLGLQNKVLFYGLVNRLQAKELLQKSHVAILHSITDSKGDQEGIPNFLMEAMALELPVISTYHAGIPELVENGVNGYLVKEKEIMDYADAIKKQYDSWRLMPENRDKIIENFERGKHTSKLESYYKDIIK